MESRNTQVAHQPSNAPSTNATWQFWIDRGGTFTDIVAQDPQGQVHCKKLLSDNPQQYRDASIAGIRAFLQLGENEPIPSEKIGAIKMGTTVATNALLEHQGEPTLLVITKGFGDALRIGYQNRPDLFARHIQLPILPYSQVLEVDERLGADGKVQQTLDLEACRQGLTKAHNAGLRSCAIVLMHGYRYPAHEHAIARLATEVGFDQVSTSHHVSPLQKLVSRGDTTVVDAYLSPILRRYVDHVAAQVGDTRLLFMQSSGGLTEAHRFQGKDSILSGPAGGVVGAVQTSQLAGCNKIIGFDMGGTSTDVCLFEGHYNRVLETTLAGIRLRVPMMAIHTVAAGGGSVLHYDDQRFRVGPDSAGANPGPACYRRGGPLTLTDCNVMLGRLPAEHFPQVFGDSGNQPLDRDAVTQKFADLRSQMGTNAPGTSQDIARGFLRIGIENMATAIKKISVQQGHDVTAFTLCCFGGAGGQHACQVADALGMTKIVIHPLAGVLSAYGMGLADLRSHHSHAVQAPLTSNTLAQLHGTISELDAEGRAQMQAQGIAPARVETVHSLQLRYDGSDTTLTVHAPNNRQQPHNDDNALCAAYQASFEAAHQQRYGFISPERQLVVDSAHVEVIGHTDVAQEKPLNEHRAADLPLKPDSSTQMVAADGAEHATPIYQRAEMQPGDGVDGPAIICEANATTVVEPGWRASMNQLGHLLLRRVEPLPAQEAVGTTANPVMLEVFNNLFMAIAERMGVTLANTAHSVNIKERLDFSCALFDQHGALIANAPHVPVHLGSMGACVQTIIEENQSTMKPGDAYVLNAPYNGGTHLPDITVVTPVFGSSNPQVLFYVASRGHHADIGGITPGSMPPDSRTVEEEGVLIDNFKLVDGGTFQEAAFAKLLQSGPYPVRNLAQNLADIKAQLAANTTGVSELQHMVSHFGLDTVHAYMQHVQDNAEASVRNVLEVLKDGSFSVTLDNNAQIQVSVRIDRPARTATIDFTGTSPQQSSNFNAPAAVCTAAVLYVFRTLVEAPIPLNAGCLKPLQIIIPPGSMLNPSYPAAVVAGNVEVSQAIADALFGALGVLAGSQQTMNNFTFGNDTYQYYETICGGSGAGPDHPGTSAVQVHMTNSRLTDPEVLESRYPVTVRQFGMRRGSGGGGAQPGGDGAIRCIQFHEPMTAAIVSNNRSHGPFGLAGGAPGQPGKNWVERADGSVQALGATAVTQVHPGDTVVIETPGGGGYGRPPAR